MPQWMPTTLPSKEQVSITLFGVIAQRYSLEQSNIRIHINGVINGMVRTSQFGAKKTNHQIHQPPSTKKKSSNHIIHMIHISVPSKSMATNPFQKTWRLHSLTKHISKTDQEQWNHLFVHHPSSLPEFHFHIPLTWQIVPLHYHSNRRRRRIFQVRYSYLIIFSVGVRNQRFPSRLENGKWCGGYKCYDGGIRDREYRL
jgi:hypothetical protein